MNITSTLSSVTICYLPILPYLTTSDGGIPISEINHTCSTTCRYTDQPVIQTTGKWSITSGLNPTPPLQYFLISRNPSIQYHMHMNMTWWAPVLYWFPSFVQLIQNYLASRQQCNNGVSSATSAVVSGVPHARIDTRTTFVSNFIDNYYINQVFLSPGSHLVIYADDIYSIALYHLLPTTSWHQLTE